MIDYLNKNYFHHLEHILSQVHWDEIQSFTLLAILIGTGDVILIDSP